MVSPEAVEEMVDSDQIAVALQPIFELDGLTVVGYEALSRFPGAESTGDWFAAARDAGLTVELDVACLAAIAATVPGHPHSGFLSVNVTSETLADERLHAALNPIVAHQPDVVVEISEEVADPEAMIEAAAELRRRAVRVALDDFGAGTLNAMHLRAIRPDILKVDNRVLDNLGEQRISNALLGGFVTLTRRSGITLVVERVESHEEFVAAWSSGADCAQGFHPKLGRPHILKGR